MDALRVIVMGVSGSGKSAIGAALAAALGQTLVEGDDFHSQASRDKMARGVALTDADRAGWLERLGRELRDRQDGVVLTCSALKARYRDSLRAQAPGLRFVHLAIDQAAALRRVAERPGHFYPPSLVASQFDALQDPRGEPRVLVLDANASPDAILNRILAWIDHDSAGKRRASPVG